ncbi:MAG: metalloregulator ArsR/SmtB family transcription factor [Lautropia sp.]|nr:metalloregulator ArsR/SmtB family transcription factor [Lautropia sp.]
MKHQKLSFEQQAAEAAGFLRALGNEHRLQVLCLLAEFGEMNVGQIHAQTTLSQSALSQHLARMRDEGLIAYRREGQTLHYSLRDARAVQLLTVLKKIFCPPDES